MDFCRTLISSGASRVASLTLTGATSSIVMVGKLDTTLTSGTGCEQDECQTDYCWLYKLYLLTCSVKYLKNLHYVIVISTPNDSIFSILLKKRQVHYIKNIWCNYAKPTGLGVKWKLDRASNFRKSVSISFWISTWAGFSSSSVCF